MKGQKHSYINSKEFYQEMVDWKNSGKEKMPDSIARKILMICTELSKSWQFNGYTENWKNDMIRRCNFKLYTIC